MEPFWSSPGYFGTQIVGSIGTDLFYGQEIASPYLLLANAVGAATGTFITDQIMAQGAVYFFMDRDQRANHGKPAHLTKDMYMAIGAGVVGGTGVNVLVRHLFFGVPLAPALMAGAVSAALTWGVWVQPRLTSVTANFGN